MTYYVVACYKVSDFERFKAEFDAAQELMRQGGFVQTILYRNVDDPSQLTVVHECEDLPKARDFYKSPQFKACIAKAGVGEPEITIMEELARTPHLMGV